MVNSNGEVAEPPSEHNNEDIGEVGRNETVITRAVQATPEAMIGLMDWIIFGELREGDIEEFLQFLKDIIAESVGSAGASAFGLATGSLNLKQKMLGLGDGVTVKQLATQAKQMCDGDEIKAIRNVVNQKDQIGGDIAKIVQDVFSVLEKVLPGGAVLSLLVRSLKKMMPEEYSLEKVTVFAAVAVRYPARVYRFLRSAFTIASLQGHDVESRCVQFEVLTEALPPLIDYLSKLVKKDSGSTNSIIPEGTASTAATWALGAMTGGTAAALFNFASLAHSVYTTHKQSAEQSAIELSEWNAHRIQILDEFCDAIAPTNDFFAIHLVPLCKMCGIAILAAPLYGLWMKAMSFESVTNAIIPFDAALSFEMRFIVMLLFSSGILMMSLNLLHRAALQFRIYKPSYWFSVLILFSRVHLWYLGYAMAKNSLDVISILMFDFDHPVFPPLIFTISAFSGLMDNDTLMWIGRILPFLVISLHVLDQEGGRHLQESRYTATIAVGVMGQLTLRHILKKKSVQRSSLYLFFDDVLEVFAAIGSPNIDPHSKLDLLTPSRPFCELICCIVSDQRALIFGLLTGVMMFMFPLYMVIISFLVVVCITLYIAVHSHSVPASCWGRWHALVAEMLPGHLDHVKYLSNVWNAYLQPRPKFQVDSNTLAPGQVRLHVFGPTVPLCCRYDISLKPSWTPEGSWLTVEQISGEELRNLQSSKSTIKHLKGLYPDGQYAVRVSAVGQHDAEQPLGDIKECHASTPVAITEAHGSLGPEGSYIKVKVDLGSSFRPQGIKIRHKKLGDLLASFKNCDSNGEYIIRDVVPGLSYEVSLQCIYEGKFSTRWFPLEGPLTVKVPHIVDDATGVVLSQENIESNRLASGVKALYGQFMSSMKQDDDSATTNNNLPEIQTNVVVTSLTSFRIETTLPEDCADMMYRARYRQRSEVGWSTAIPWAVSGVTLPTKAVGEALVVEGLKTGASYEVQIQAMLNGARSWWPEPGHVIKLELFVTATFDFVAENENELSFSKGDKIKIVREIDQNWFEGTFDSRTGCFPKSHATLCS
eukprot:m.85971 g.85971  ORF g.85971 m.85971 type:complete len:1046 (-) comp13035_c0_seq1:130-3267(-)